MKNNRDFCSQWHHLRLEEVHIVSENTLRKTDFVLTSTAVSIRWKARVWSHHLYHPDQLTVRNPGSVTTPYRVVYLNTRTHSICCNSLLWPDASCLLLLLFIMKGRNVALFTTTLTELLWFLWVQTTLHGKTEWICSVVYLYLLADWVGDRDKGLTWPL